MLRIGSLLLLLLKTVLSFTAPNTPAFITVGASNDLSKAFEISSVVESSSSQNVAAVDLAGFLTDNLSGFINSPAILILPIGVAVSIGLLVVWFLVSSANPTIIENKDK